MSKILQCINPFCATITLDGMVCTLSRLMRTLRPSVEKTLFKKETTQETRTSLYFHVRYMDILPTNNGLHIPRPSCSSTSFSVGSQRTGSMSFKSDSYVRKGYNQKLCVAFSPSRMWRASADFKELSCTFKTCMWNDRINKFSFYRPNKLRRVMLWYRRVQLYSCADFKRENVDSIVLQAVG